MIKDIELQLSPGSEPEGDELIRRLSSGSGIPAEEISSAVLLRRSIDARGKNIRLVLRYRLFTSPDSPDVLTEPEWKDVSKAEPVHIIGAGPAGLFAALTLLEAGLKPVIIERGKDVRNRRRDLALINREGIVDPDSNYCFGEGGAGTYSDGKLYTRSTKRGDVQAVLRLLVAHGADPGILADAHPHIGTNKLPGIITAMRERILSCGGEVHFSSRLEDISLKEGKVNSIVTSAAEAIPVKRLILATGHSARDIFSLFRSKQWQIEFKPYALGVRVEHPQELINRIQYHNSPLTSLLPPAAYSLVHQAGNRGVYSFCMCPGGIIAACATGPEEVVTNGWSPSRRNNPYANSGIVVEVGMQDIKQFAPQGAFAGLAFQQEVEKMAYTAGGGKLKAPAQRLTDFVKGKLSESLPACSYHPGIQSAPLHEILPAFIGKRLQEGFLAFGKKMNGYLTRDAVVVGVESRTSSPVRIPRDTQTLEHPQIAGLYPCGEGAGYAGGIVSAAIDGIKCAARISAEIQR